MMGAVHLLPGATQSNPQGRRSYDAEERAALTLAELERWLVLQICRRGPPVYTFGVSQRDNQPCSKHVTRQAALATAPTAPTLLSVPN
jgi:hypothetical protein